MRIGLVSPYSFDAAGGVQNQILGLADWLHTRGHEVSIFGPGKKPGIVSAGPAVPVRFNASTARIRLTPGHLRRLRQWAETLDVVHVHEPYVPLLGPQAARLPKPVVATFHAAIHPRWAGLAQRWLRLNFDAVTAVSALASSVPRALGLRPEVIPNAIKVASFQPAQRPGPLSIAFVGRFDEPRKGFDVLAQALPIIRAAHRDLVVRVVGSGRKRIPGVQFLGELPDAQRNAVLANSHVFVAPQLGAESFGIVLCEALASGAMVVASSLPAFRAVASDAHGPLAEFFNPGDPTELARAVLAGVRRDPVPRDRVVAHLSGFDWDAIAPKFESLYTRFPAIA